MSVGGLRFAGPGSHVGGSRSHHGLETPRHQRAGPWPVLHGLLQHILVPHFLATKEAQRPLGTSPQPKRGREKEVPAWG